MSSNRAQYADRAPVENSPRHAAVTWPWPIGARGVLAGLVLFAAMGLALASRFDPPSSVATFIVAPELAVDPNTVPARVLTALPHVGPSLVRSWAAARDDRPFSSLDDAERRVRGLGPATLIQIAPYLRFETSTQSEGPRIASSSSDRVFGKPQSTRRKSARSKSPRQATKSSRPGLVAQSSDLEAQRQVSIARHDR
jgi:competence protein ComEA